MKTALGSKGTSDSIIGHKDEAIPHRTMIYAFRPWAYPWYPDYFSNLIIGLIDLVCFLFSYYCF